MLQVPGADAKAGDRNYLVLAKPNVIINDIRSDSEGWEWREVMLPVGGALTTTPRPLGT